MCTRVACTCLEMRKYHALNGIRTLGPSSPKRSRYTKSAIPVLLKYNQLKRCKVKNVYMGRLLDPNNLPSRAVTEALG